MYKQNWDTMFGTVYRFE